MMETTKVCSRRAHDAIVFRPTSISNDYLLQKRRRRRQQLRSRRFVNKKHINAVQFFFFVHSLLVHRGSVAFILHLPPSRLQLQSTSKITTTLFANNHHHPAEHELPSKLDEPKTNPSISCNNVVVTRRASLASAAVLATTFIPKNPATAAANNDYTPPKIITPSTINNAAYAYNNKPPIIPSLTIPLQYQPTLSAYTIAYKVGNSPFGAIIDTGSPFLLVPQSSKSSCRPEYRWGCFHPEESRPAVGLDPTLERFDGNEGVVEWREGTFSFDMAVTNDEEEIGNADKDGASSLSLSRNAAVSTLEEASLSSNAAASQSLLFPKSLMTFGVISESLMDGPGGIFMGLVKKTDHRIRPSFLGQSDVSAFSIDLREKEGGSKSLTLYAGTTPAEEKSMASFLPSFQKVDTSERTSLGGMFSTQNAIRCNLDLNKKYGDPTIHYVGVASSITANGSNLASTSHRNGKIYCIFDTGCSGMSVSPGLFDERYATARAQKEKSLWGTVDVELTTIAGETVTLSAKRPITTPLGSERPWGKKLDGHLIVLGLSFLEGRKMTVDSDGGFIWFED